MKIAISYNNNPYWNLALEEYLLKNKNIKDDFILIYINENTIVFGRNQNIHEEIHHEFVAKHNINLVRRISGGGAVYHDKGNINFSFITDNKRNSYKTFLEPIIKFLNSLNLNAKFHGKNDLVIDGMKVSGNAQYIHKNRMFHHGTLLFDTNLSKLSLALNPNELKLQSKSIKSIRQRVSNINDLLETKMSPSQFVSKLENFFISNYNAKIINLDIYNKDEIKNISNYRQSKEWLFKKNPEFNISNIKRFNGGTIKFKAMVKKNLIHSISFEGDFLSSNNFDIVNSYFVGEEYTYEKLKKIIRKIDSFENFFGKITRDELFKLLI